MLETVVRRFSNEMLYPALFDRICEANHWDKQTAVALRSTIADIERTRLQHEEADDTLRRIRDAFPPHWIREGCVMGSASECTRAVLDRFEAGADGVVFHAGSPCHLARFVDAWRNVRPSQRFAGRASTPGRG
jgi:hypothetical protein